MKGILHDSLFLWLYTKLSRFEFHAKGAAAAVMWRT